MCTVSMIGDVYQRQLPGQYPWAVPSITYPSTPNAAPNATSPLISPSREEFEALKREVETMRELLKAAKLYDEQTGQADCETDEKVALLKAIAKKVGVDLSEIFGGDA